MIARLLRAVGLRSTYLHGASLSAVTLSLSLWIRAKTVDQEARGNAERRAIFVGHWAPMFWLIGDAVSREEVAREEAQRRRRPRLSRR